MRILITGTTGFVGHKLKASYTDAIAAPSLRNATQDMIKKIVEESEADVVIHTAAISDIGTCQKDPQSSVADRGFDFLDGFSRCAGHSECFPRYCYLGSQNAGSAVAGKFYFSGRYFYFDRKNIFAFFADFSVGYENSNVNTGNCHSGKAAAGEKGKRHSSIGIKAKGG